MKTLPPLRRLLLAVVLFGLAAGFVVGPLAWVVPAFLVGFVVLGDLAAALRRGVLGVDIIALLAIAGAIALGEHLAAVIIALMVAGGSALEEFAEARARRELAALVGRTPRVAHRREEDRVVDVAVDSVQPNDMLLIKPGEILPVDGIVGTDAATLDESALTGEPLPVTRTHGDPVSSGVVNAGGPFNLLATAAAAHSTYAAVVRLVHAAERDRPPLVRLADRWALGFLIVTIVLGGGAWWVTGDAIRALAVLVVATPCPLILAAPVALICGVSRAARRGIIVKGGGVLERLARARTVLFDKTGTLTTGTPRVTGVETLDERDADEVLQHAASLAQVSQHVVAGAIVTAARSLALPLVLPLDVEEVPGGGLAGKVGDVRVLVGSAGLLDAAGIPPPTEGAAARMAAAAASVAWVAFDGRVAGALLLADRIRPETPRALRALRAAGVTRLVMVSGDRPASAEAVAMALGLDAVHADLSPAGKIELVRGERAAVASSTVGAVGFSIWMCLPAAIAWRTRAGRSPVAAQSMKIASGPANASSRFVVHRWLPLAAESAFNRPASRPTNSRSGINRSPLRNANPPSAAIASRLAMCWVVPMRPVAPLMVTPICRSLIRILLSTASGASAQ